MLNSGSLETFPSSAKLVIARFGCGVMLHMQLQNELDSGLKNMKFAMNHYYRFDRPDVAFLAGLLQAVSIFVIEFVNFIVIMTSSTFLDVVMNFLALAVIAEFDDAFFGALGADDIKEIIGNPAYEDLYKVTRTTSSFASKSFGNELEDDTLPAKPEDQLTWISIKFGD